MKGCGGQSYRGETSEKKAGLMVQGVMRVLD